MAGLSSSAVPSREALRAFARDYRTAGGSRDRAAGDAEADCVVTVGADTRTRNGNPEQVSGYQRNNPNCGDDAPHNGVVLVRDGAVPRSAPSERRPAAPARAWEGQPNQSWRQQIAAEETRRSDGDFGYGMSGQPGSSALGRYQLLRDPLIDAGWRDRVSSAWSARARSAGVTSDAEFLANPVAQETAFNDVLRANERQLRANGAMGFDGQRLTGLRGGEVPITEAGLAAAAHREGARTVRRYLDHRAANLPAPPAIAGRRGDLSRFNEVERRLQGFAGTPYQRVSP